MIEPSDELIKLCTKDVLLKKIVEKCFQLEYSKGMGRVIHRTLIKHYKEADKSYINSLSYKHTCNNIIMRLENLPERRFSHINDLCESLKLNAYRNKKGQITTLSTNLKEFNGNVLRKENNLGIRTTTDIIEIEDVDTLEVQEHPEIIHLDEETGVIDLDNDSIEEPVIYVDDYQSDVVIIDEENENKDNHKSNSSTLNWVEDHNFSTPHTFEDAYVNSVESNISLLKDEIESTKKLVDQLDQTEVVSDSIYSPYIIVDSYKAKIVRLYRALCKLTGKKLERRREVRLKVKTGHPEGPVRRLEAFLNSKMDGCQEPPFPDFLDVVKCVELAVEEDGLQWTKTQIFTEARLIFIRCGEALQKRRQKREWRELTSGLKCQVDQDPADVDPELRARLDANKRIARQKEKRLLERYSEMQSAQGSRLQPTQLSTIEIVDNDDTRITDDPSVQVASETNNNEVKRMKKEPTENIAELLNSFDKDFSTTVVDIEDPFLVIEISESDGSDDS